MLTNLLIYLVQCLPHCINILLKSFHLIFLLVNSNWECFPTFNTALVWSSKSLLSVNSLLLGWLIDRCLVHFTLNGIWTEWIIFLHLWFTVCWAFLFSDSVILWASLRLLLNSELLEMVVIISTICHDILIYFRLWSLYSWGWICPFERVFVVNSWVENILRNVFGVIIHSLCLISVNYIGLRFFKVGTEIEFIPSIHLA